MADNQIVTNIVATSDFSNLIADVNKVSNSLAQLQGTISSTNKQLQAQVAVMNRSFADTIRSTGQFSKHFITLTSDVESFGKNLDSGRLKLKDYFRVYQDHVRTSGGLIRDLAKQQIQMQNAIVQPLGRNAQGLMQFNVHVPRGLDTIKNKTALARQELSIMNKVIQDGGVQLINWGKNTQWAGRQLTVGLTLPLAAFGKAAADAFRQADQELTRLTKVYGDIAGTSKKELSSIRKEVAQTAKELSAAMGVNFSETIALAADIAATGKQGNELLSSIKETTRLAVLGEVDRQEAMKATLAIQSAFKQNTEQLAESINFLNAVENQTSTTLNDLVEAIPKAGPVIKGLGGDVQDLALYLTAMREGGINASEGANALKSALASLINPTDKAVEKFQGFGIDLLGIVNKNAGDVTKTLFALQGALDKLNPLQKQQAIEQLFGKFQFSRLNALFENLGRQGSQTLQVLDLMKASTFQLGAIADRELAAVTESASGRYKRAVESLRADLAGVGDKFLNIATKLINGLDSIINFLQKLPDPVKNLLTVAGAFTAIAGPVIMLTGVLANFVGYLIKGYGHIKAFLKGGEGFRLLTPQMIAAEKAANLVASSLYSDAKAADILHTSLTRLKNDFLELQTIAAKGSISVQPTLSTAAGSIVIPGGGYRQVDPTNPFVGGMASSHINPRDPKNPATLFGLVPGAEFVNMKIGRTPQVFMEERLPNIEGLTSVKANLRGKPYDISTGIVAGEAARYQALMATLGMQSKQEIIELKKTVEAGGAISTDFIATFDDLLPITTRLSTNAARQSAAIVADLQAGKLTVEQARAEIIRLNAQLEAGLGAEVTAYATGKGRQIDVTKVPLINQPVVDPRTGKPNMRALFREGRMQDVMFAVGRATRTRTMGAPYSIETTLPPRFNVGGRVERFGRGRTRVSGSSSINYDDRLGALPENGYVLSQGASRRFPELVALAPYTHTDTPGTITAAVTPAETVFGSGIHSIPGLPERLDQANFGMNLGGRIKKGRGNYGQFKIDPKTLRRAHITDDLSGMVILLPDYVNAGISARGAGVQAGMIATVLREMLSQGIDPNLPMIDAATTLGGDKAQASRRLAAAMGELINELETNPERILGGSSHPMSFERLAKGIYRNALRGIRIDPMRSGGTNNLFTAVSQIYSRRAGRKITKDRAIELGIVSGEKTGSNILGQIVRRKSGRLSWSMPQQNIGADVPDWARGTSLSRLLTTSTGVGSTVTGYQKTGRLFNLDTIRDLYVSRLLRRNNGGSVPGKAGGRVLRGRFNYGDYYQDPFTGLILPTSVQPGQTQRMLPGIHGGNFIPLSSVASGGMGGVPLTSGRQATNPYMAGALTGRQRMMGFGASMLGSFGGGYLGSKLTGGSMLGMFGGSMLGEFAAITAFNKLGASAGQAAQKTSLLSRGIGLISSLPGPVKLVGIVLAVGGAIKEINDKIKEHRTIINQAFAPTENTVEKLKLKYESLNDTLKTAKARIDALQQSGISLFERNNQTGIPGLTLTIQQLKELQEAVKTDFPDLIDIFNKAKPDEVIGKAAQLKAQFVAGGMSAEDATNFIYTLVAASNDATLAIQAINSKGFKEIKTGAEAAAYSIQVMFDLIKEGNVDQLSAAFDQAYNSLRNYEKSLINTKDDQGEILNRVGALEKTLQLINARSQANVELSGKQLEAVKKQNPELRAILGNVEDTAGAYAKIQLYTMGITGNLQDMNSAAAQAKLLAVTGVMSTLESTTGPFSSLAKQIANQQKIVNSAGVQAAKVFAKTRDQINAEIKLRQKNIQQIKEEADARIKALQEAQEDEDILLKIKEKQLDYQAALASGDLTGATAAQLEIQGLVNQQQRTLAVRSIQTDADARIKTLEAEIDNLQDRLDAAQGRLDNANDNAATAAKKLADLEALMDKAIQSVLIKLNNPQLTKDQTATIEEARKLFKTSYPDIYRLLDPNIKIPFNDSPLGNLTDSLLQKVLQGSGNNSALRVYLSGGAKGILDLFKGDQVAAGGAPAATPAKYEAVTTGTGTKFTKDGKEISAEEYNRGQYSPGSPPVGAGKAYVHPIAELRQRNFGNRASVIKAYDELGYKNGVMTSTSGWKYYSTGKVIGPNGEQGVWFDSRVRSYNSGGYMPGYPGGTTDGPIMGPGTGTSDSIIARLSDGEYVTKAVSVSDIGVDNMHLINTKGSQGLLQAARNIVDENKAMGGLIGLPKFPTGGWLRSIGKGLTKAKSSISSTFNNIMDYLGVKSNDPTDLLILEEAIRNATTNKLIVPQLPTNLKQAQYLMGMYKDHSKFFEKFAKQYKDSDQTVGLHNASMQRMSNFMKDSGPKIIDHNPIVKDFNDFLQNVNPSDFNKPISPIDKDFFGIVSNPEIGASKDTGFTGSGLKIPGLFDPLQAPENITLYDYYMGKAAENRLIQKTYADIIKVIKYDPLLARKYGLLNEKGLALGGSIKIPGYGKGEYIRAIGSGIKRIGSMASSAFRHFFPEKASINRTIDMEKFGEELDPKYYKEVKVNLKGPDAQKKLTYFDTIVRQYMYAGRTKEEAINDAASFMSSTSLDDVIKASTKERNTEAVRDLIRKYFVDYEQNSLNNRPGTVPESTVMFYKRLIQRFPQLSESGSLQDILEKAFRDVVVSDPMLSQATLKQLNTTSEATAYKLMRYYQDDIIKALVKNNNKKLDYDPKNIKIPLTKEDASLLADEGSPDKDSELFWSTYGGKAKQSEYSWANDPEKISEFHDLVKSMADEEGIEWTGPLSHKSRPEIAAIEKKALEFMKLIYGPVNDINPIGKTGPRDVSSLIPFSILDKESKNAAEVLKFKKWLEGVSPEQFNFPNKAMGGYIPAYGKGGWLKAIAKGAKSLFTGAKNIFAKSPLKDPLKLNIKGLNKKDNKYLQETISYLYEAVNRGRTSSDAFDPYTGVPTDPMLPKSVLENTIFNVLRNKNPERSTYSSGAINIEMGGGEHYRSKGTILHELMHAISDKTGLGETVANQYYKDLLASKDPVNADALDMFLSWNQMPTRLQNSYLTTLDEDELNIWYKGAALFRGLEEGLADTAVTNIYRANAKGLNPKLASEIYGSATPTRGMGTYVTTEKTSLEDSTIGYLQRILDAYSNPNTKDPVGDLVQVASELTPEFIDSYMFASSGALTDMQMSNLLNLKAFLTPRLDFRDAVNESTRVDYITNVANAINDLQTLKAKGMTLKKIYKFDKGGMSNADPTTWQKIKAGLLVASDLSGLTDVNAVTKQIARDLGADVDGPNATAGNFGWAAASLALLGRGKSIAQFLTKHKNIRRGSYGLMGLAALGIPDLYNERLAGVVGKAGGGYINPSYFSSMSMPSYATGVKYLYDDTIAQLHKGEAVIPENMNPFNPNASTPLGGGNKLVYIAPTINAAPGMDIEQLTDVATRKIVEVMRKSESDYSARSGEKLSMTRRYV